jgi:hypothetical protein
MDTTWEVFYDTAVKRIAPKASALHYDGSVVGHYWECPVCESEFCTNGNDLAEWKCLCGTTLALNRY